MTMILLMEQKSFIESMRLQRLLCHQSIQKLDKIFPMLTLIMLIITSLIIILNPFQIIQFAKDPLVVLNMLIMNTMSILNVFFMSIMNMSSMPTNLILTLTLTNMSRTILIHNYILHLKTHTQFIM